MKRFVRNALRTGVPYGLFMGIFWGLQDNFVAGISGGLFSGIFFGLAMASFMAYQTRGFTNSLPSFTDETLIIDGQASYFLNKKGAVGWLYLTDKRLLFLSHASNAQLREQSIPINDIAEVVKAKSFGVIANRLHLIRKHGGKERFVVENLSIWIDRIEEGRNKYLDYHEPPKAGLFD